MNAIDAIGLLLAAGLFVYLLAALLYPERFQ
jgi:K+-transporting ATPase KdpF subunit